MQHNIPEFKILVGGELCDSPKRMDVINPATGEVLARCPATTPAMVDQAVAAAARAFPAWAAKSWEERSEVLLKIADAVEARKEEIARIITLEQGKPIAQSRMEVDRGAASLRGFVKLKQEPEVLQDDAVARVEVHRKPLGVVVAIVPWNVPFMQSLQKIGPAIVVGNTVILKTAPSTPLNGLLLGEILAGIVPPGVVSILSDAGDVGPLLVSHKGVAKVSFTGSVNTGKSVMAEAAGTLKRVTLELGGNDVAIVLDDVDVKTVAPKVYRFAFFNGGQVCVSIKRIYVQAGIYDEFCEALAAIARGVKVGDGMDPATEMGPLQNLKQFEATKGYLAAAKKYGKVIAGGEVIDGPGYFVQPTIVRDITEGNSLVDEETFGPVRSVLRFDDVEEVIGRANNSPFGLGGSVWTSNTARGVEIANRIESGTVWVNQHMVAGAHIPFGGAKYSGMGSEFGREGLAEFTRVHVINVAKG